MGWRSHVRGAAVWCGVTLAAAAYAQEPQHIVPLSELHERALQAARERQENLRKLDELLAQDGAAAALKAINVDSEQVRNAVALLNDQDVEMLTERAQQATASFPKRALTRRETLYIAIGVAAAATLALIFAT